MAKDWGAPGAATAAAKTAAVVWVVGDVAEVATGEAAQEVEAVSEVVEMVVAPKEVAVRAEVLRATVVVKAAERTGAAVVTVAA